MKPFSHLALAAFALMLVSGVAAAAPYSTPADTLVREASTAPAPLMVADRSEFGGIDRDALRERIREVIDQRRTEIAERVRERLQGLDFESRAAEIRDRIENAGHDLFDDHGGDRNHDLFDDHSDDLFDDRS
jgi:hypothetical protein